MSWIFALLPIAQEQPTRVWDKLDDVTRVRIQMALIALLILMAAMFVMIRMGGRWVRRLGKTEPSRPRLEPPPFLKPLTEEEAQRAITTDETADGDAPDTGADDEASDAGENDSANPDE